MVAAKTGTTEKVDSLWKQIQEALQRNVSTGGATPSGSLSSARLLLQQGEALDAGSRHQLLDALVAQVNEAIRTVQRQGADSRNNEIEFARNVVSEACAAKQV